MRAIAHDIEAAKLMGINTDSVISFTFVLGGALAGAGGVLVAALTHVKITPLFGLMPGIKAFVAAVLGGAGSVPGAALGGILMGVAEAFVAGSQPLGRRERQISRGCSARPRFSFGSHRHQRPRLIDNRRGGQRGPRIRRPRLDPAPADTHRKRRVAERVRIQRHASIARRRQHDIDLIPD